MTASILYCGDTNLEGAACYLAGILTYYGLTFDYIPSHVQLSRQEIENRQLFIFSDYPASQVSVPIQQAIVRSVARGAGFLMIGGWESFHGFGGNWDGTPIAEMLPVEIQTKDDRLNFCHGAILAPPRGVSGLWDLPWEAPPVIGGANRLELKEGRDWNLLLQAFPMTPHRFQPHGQKEFEFEWKPSRCSYPILVTSDDRRGRVASFASDVAPHWVGGFVDWGDKRVSTQAAGANAIEVGSYYSLFWKQLLAWTGRLKVNNPC